MFIFLKTLLKAAAVQSVIKATTKGLAGLFTRNATSAARAYADKVAEEASEALPEMIGKLGEIRYAYQQGKVGLNVTTALQAGYFFGLPTAAYQHYQQYQRLNRTAAVSVKPVGQFAKDYRALFARLH